MRTELHLPTTYDVPRPIIELLMVYLTISLVSSYLFFSREVERELSAFRVASSLLRKAVTSRTLAKKGDNDA
jgi:hypothetical protein